MSKIATNLKEILKHLEGTNTKLIAVSKTKPNEDIFEAYNAGHRDFGENKVQEMTLKSEELPKDIHWHMIGHLQRNKVKFIAPYVYLIHSIDSVRLLAEVNKEAKKNDRIINCLLQIHIAEESTKFGFDEQELEAFLKSGELENYTAVKIVGLMGMATFTDNTDQIHREFAHLKSIFDKFSNQYTFDNFHLLELSMGMSGDYKIAMEHGSTLIRVGSSIFGERNYG